MPTSPTTFADASVSEWNPSDRMLIAPLAYPKAIFAAATPRFNRRTRTSTFATAAYRSPVIRDSGVGIRLVTVVRRSMRIPKPESRIPSKYPRCRNRPPSQLHFSDDVLLRHHAPMAAVGAVVAVIAHHEVVALRN